MLCKSQRNICKLSTCFAGVKTAPYKLCRGENKFLHTFRGSKRHHTRFAAVKTDSPSICKSTSRIAGFKTYSPNFYEASYTLCLSKNGLSVHLQSLLHALQGSKRPAKSFAGVKSDSYTLYVDQNAAIHALRGSKLILRSFTRLTHALRLSKRILRPSRSFLHALW